MSNTIPVIGLFFLGAMPAMPGLVEIPGGRVEWAALPLVATALCLCGIRLRIKADAEWRGASRPSEAGPLERAVQLLWAFAGGVAMALGLVQWGAGQQEAATVYLMAAGVCALGLTVQLAAPTVFDRHSR